MKWAIAKAASRPSLTVELIKMAGEVELTEVERREFNFRLVCLLKSMTSKELEGKTIAGCFRAAGSEKGV